MWFEMETKAVLLWFYNPVDRNLLQIATGDIKYNFAAILQVFTETDEVNERSHVQASRVECC